jgi:hypothetical protein
VLEAIKNFFRVGGLLARIIDFIDDRMIEFQAMKERKAVQDALIARANDVRAGELPDDPRDYRD